MNFPTLEFKISWILLIKWMCLKKQFVVFELTYCQALENLSFYSQFLGLPSACGRAKLLRTQIGNKMGVIFLMVNFFWRIFQRIFLTIFFETIFFDKIFFDKFFLEDFYWPLIFLTIASFRIGVPLIFF